MERKTNKTLGYPKRMNSILQTILGTAVIILIWGGTALAVGQEIILPSPASAFDSLLALFGTSFFWNSVYRTFLRGIAAFAVSLTAGTILGTAAGYFRNFNFFFRPFIILIRSTPVVSFILIALFWLSSSQVPILTAVLMSFPVICINVIHGVESIDKNLSEMTVLFRFSPGAKIRHLILPSIYPFLLAGGSTGLGLAWKAVVAAEVLSSPRFGIGTGLQDSRIYLDTPGVFAWTVVAILLSALAELIFTILGKMKGIKR
jgi:NitT/TauT family transport system permease protein